MDRKNMFSTQIASLVLLIIFLHTANAASRAFILKGRRAREGEFPYAAAVRVASKDDYNVSKPHCGGSIISRNYILTAAHCVKDKKFRPIVIRVGSIDAEGNGGLVFVDEVIIHSYYHIAIYNKNALFDIALIKLVEPLQFNKNIQPIRLANRNPPDGAVVSVAGWGKTCDKCIASQFLLYARNTLKYSCNFEWELCLHSPLDNGACEGDSGGPAIYNNTLVGVASFLKPDGGRHCGSKKPDVYMSIAYFRNWILRNSGVNEDL